MAVLCNRQGGAHGRPVSVVSQGHTTLVAVNHYLGLPFDRRDKEEMVEWVAGWEK